MGDEDLQMHLGVLADLLNQPGGRGFIQDAGLPSIGSGDGNQGVEAAALISIPPVFQSADGVAVAVLIRPGA